MALLKEIISTVQVDGKIVDVTYFVCLCLHTVYTHAVPQLLQTVYTHIAV